MHDDNMEDILLDVQQYRKTELIDYYVEDLERLAKENQVTVDYYIAEFTWASIKENHCCTKSL